MISKKLGAYTISLDPILLLPLHVICPREFCEAPVTTSSIILLSDVIRFFLRWWAPSMTDDEDKLFAENFQRESSASCLRQTLCCTRLQRP
jgi:hypothetical protein